MYRLEISGLEPLTSALQKQRCYQLSYIPVDYAGFEPSTSVLSGQRSNQTELIIPTARKCTVAILYTSSPT